MLTRLPHELLINIYSYLSPEQMALATFLNRATRNIYRDNLFWRNKFKIHFSHLSEELLKQKEINWYHQFRIAYTTEYKKLTPRLRKLFSLVKEGDKNSLKAVKISKEDLERCDSKGLTLIEWAQRINNQIILDYFFEIIKKYYIDSKKTNFKGVTLLHYAIYCYQSPKVIELLIQQGHSPDALTSDGASPLLFAAEFNRIDAVNMLLKHRANPSLAIQTSSPFHDTFKVVSDDTPLHVAARLGHKEIVVALLENDAFVDILNSQHTTALMLAAQEGHAEIAEILIAKGANINMRSAMGATPLLFSVEHQHKNVVDVLLKNNANAEIALREENPYHTKRKVFPQDRPLHVAVKLGNSDIVKALLEKGADTNAMNLGFTALMLCFNNDRGDIAELILSHDPSSLNARTIAGATALIFTIEHNAPKFFNTLLNHNADSSIPVSANHDYHKKYDIIAGDTPLHAAARLNREMMVKQLILKNANCAALNSRQEEPSYVAPSDASFLPELKLKSETTKRNNLPDTYRKSLSLFGHEFFQYGLPNKPLKNALNALTKVYYENAPKATLKPHEEALNSSEIQSIYLGLRIH